MRSLSASLIFVLLYTSTLAPAAAQGDSQITGVVVDIASRLPLSDATIVAIGSNGRTSAKSDANGRFALTLPSGTYVLDATRTGYIEAESDPVNVDPTTPRDVTISLQIARSEQNLQTIGRVSTLTGAALQKSSFVFKELTGEDLVKANIFRAFDALKYLPGVTDSIGDTTAAGDDARPEIRGFGRLETNQTIDGDPIAVNVQRKQGGANGYNFDVSPSFLFQNFQVNYGAGATAFTGVNAIGGTIDMQTLLPTVTPHMSLIQGFGDYAESTTIFNATGTKGRLGYAFAAGTYGNNIPFQNVVQYQPGASVDAQNPAQIAAATYNTNSGIWDKGAIAKLTYRLGSDKQPINLLFSALTMTHYNDKTGNGDNTFLPYSTALQIADGLTKAKTDTCPAGYFNPSLTKGVNYNGQSSTVTTCLTAAQIAANNAGPQGTGPAWQTFHVGDYHSRADIALGKTTLTVDGFTNTYYQDYERPYALPYVADPLNPLGKNSDIESVDSTASGFTVSDTVQLGPHELSLGYYLDNNTYHWDFAGGVYDGNPNTHPSVVTRDNAVLFRDAFHPDGWNTTIYGFANFKNSTGTNTFYFDPRLSVVTNVSRNDVIRTSVGMATTQPYSLDLVNTFKDTSGGAAAFITNSSTFNCSGVNAIGSATGTDVGGVQPERAIDEDLSYSHRFTGDTMVSLDLYNSLIYNKIFNAQQNLYQSGNAFAGSAYLAPFIAAAQAKCPGVDPNTILGVTANTNLPGMTVGRGFDLSGRVRFFPKFFVDYDWSLESIALSSAPAAFLAANPTVVVGGQLIDGSASIPPHKLTVSEDAIFGRGIDLRITQNWVSDENTRSIPNYLTMDARLLVPITKNISFNLSATNLFNYDPGIYGYIGEGVLPLMNQYASAATILKQQLKQAASPLLPATIFFSINGHI